MELKHQVVSLEIATQLKSLGVQQESLFYWSFYDGGNSKKDPGIIFTDEANHGFEEDLVSAFTVAELGEMMPIGAEFGSSSSKATGGWNASYHHADPSKGYSFGDYTEADARGRLLIYLLHHGLQDK